MIKAFKVCYRINLGLWAIFNFFIIICNVHIFFSKNGNKNMFWSKNSVEHHCKRIVLQILVFLYSAFTVEKGSNFMLNVAYCGKKYNGIYYNTISVLRKYSLNKFKLLL